MKRTTAKKNLLGAIDDGKKTAADKVNLIDSIQGKADQPAEKPKPKTRANTPAKSTAKKPAAKPKKEAPKKRETAVRDTFTFPPEEHEIIEKMRKELFLEEDIMLNKSEIVRLGLLMLRDSSKTARKKTLKNLTLLNSGRPAK